VNLEKTDPLFVETVLEIPDDYARRVKTYKRLKSLNSAPAQQPSIKEKIEENARNPFYIPSSVATPPGGVDFDVSSKEARAQAYAKLKAAQKNLGTPAPR
jgi:hypothetical protein